jgi:uncharacterized lipoprotein YddW (UPF0748 family)
MLVFITGLIFASIASFLSATSCKGDPKMPGEIRAMWVARWDITSPEACRTLVKLSKDYGFNTLFVQVRGRGDALYKSSYEPRSELLEGQREDFDPLGLILEEGHKAGLQIHAWINANFTWSASDLPKSPDHIVNKHPDWLMRTKDNVVNMSSGDDVEGVYTCPSSEEFREHLKNVYLDVATKYDVDGVHFDFIRYPSPRFCYCDRCLEKFRSEMDPKLAPEERVAVSNLPERNAYTLMFPGAWDEFRRSQITRLVYTIYEAVKKLKPNLVVSAAVFPSFADAYNNRFQDWKRWMRDRRIDLLCPMAYSKSTDMFVKDIKNALESSNGVPICAGIGSWQIPAESTVEKIKEARKLGAVGFCLFSYSITDGGKKTDYLEAVRNGAPPL